MCTPPPCLLPSSRIQKANPFPTRAAFLFFLVFINRGKKAIAIAILPSRPFPLKTKTEGLGEGRVERKKGRGVNNSKIFYGTTFSFNI